MGAKQIKPQPERVRRIKEEKERQGLSIQQVADIALEMGEYTSFSSVRRVTLDGSEEVGFRDATLLPIERALGIHHGEAGADTAEVQAEFYRNIIRELNGQLKASRKVHAIKNAAIAFLLFLLVGLLAVDRIVPGVGWYGTSHSAVWWCIFVTVGAFLFALAAFHIHLGVYRRQQDEAEAEPEE